MAIIFNLARHFTIKYCKRVMLPVSMNMKKLNRSQIEIIQKEFEELEQTNCVCKLKKLSIILLLKTPPILLHSHYKYYVKGTIQEERADIVISVITNLVLDPYSVYNLDVVNKYLSNWTDLLHVLLKIRFNKIRPNWRHRDLFTAG